MCVCVSVQDAEKFKEEFERCQQQLQKDDDDTLTTGIKKLTVEERDEVWQLWNRKMWMLVPSHVLSVALM